eukprot:SAG31_NODE_1544_length_7943_cov_4.076237_5_plen_303_part_00
MISPVVLLHSVMAVVVASPTGGDGATTSATDAGAEKVDHKSDAPKVAVVPAVAEHTATVIWLHGLGEEAKHWSGIAVPAKAHLAHVRWLFPTARRQIISRHPGDPVPAWFDFPTYKFRDDGLGFRDEDQKGLEESTSVISSLVQNEIKQFGIPPDHIVVGGFSQGGVVALNLVCASANLSAGLAGVVTIGSWIPLAGACAHPTQHASSTPVMMLHGAEDKLVPASAVEGAASMLADRGMKTLTFRRLPHQGHSGSGGATENVLQFVEQILKHPSSETRLPSLDLHLPPARQPHEKAASHHEL